MALDGGSIKGIINGLFLVRRVVRRTIKLGVGESTARRVRSFWMSTGNMDGGYSWLACVVGFIIQFIVAGQNNCSGIIFAALLDKYNTSTINRGQTAWVTAIASGSMHAFGMVPAVLGDRFGPANVIILGGFVCVVGLLSSSFVGSIHALYVTYGFVWGFGSCLCFCSALFVLPKFFRKRIGLANGIVFLGAPVGALVLSPVIQNLVSSIGLSKTFRVLAGIQLLLVLCGFVTRFILLPKQDQLNLKSKKFSFDWSIFKNKGYLTLVVSMCVFMPAYLVPYVHLVRLARDSGVDAIKAAFLVSFLAFGSLVARPLFGKLMDQPRVNRVTALQLALLSMSISTALVPIATNYEYLATFAFMYGFIEGCVLIALPLIVQDLVGVCKLAPALGSLYFFLSIPKAAGPSIAGWIYDTSDSYALAFFCAGGITIVSMFILFIVPLFKTNSFSKGEVQLSESSESNKKKILVKETIL